MGKKNKKKSKMLTALIMIPLIGSIVTLYSGDKKGDVEEKKVWSGVEGRGKEVALITSIIAFIYTL